MTVLSPPGLQDRTQPATIDSFANSPTWRDRRGYHLRQADGLKKVDLYKLTQLGPEF